MLRIAGVVAVIVACASVVAGAQEQVNAGPAVAPFASAIQVSFGTVSAGTGLQPVRQLPLLGAGATRLAGSAQIGAPDPQAEKPPQPRHTGLSALWRNSADDFKEFPRRKSTWTFIAVGALAALAVHPVDHDVNRHLLGNPAASRIFDPGKYLGGWTQVSAGVGMYLIGRYALPPENGTEHTNKWSHLGFDLVRAQILTQAFTQAIKQTARRPRPTGECCSFPSGHSSATFATAAVIERHLGLRGAWPTVLLASYVAISRLHDNRHYLSDVIFGAALGTATGWTVVGRHGRSSYAWTPITIPGGIGVMVTHGGPG